MFESVLFQVKQWNEELEWGWKKGWRERRKGWSEAEFAECGCGGKNLELQTEHICPGTTETQLTQTSAPTSSTLPFPGENSISQSSEPAKQEGSPFLRARHGDVLRAAGSELPRNSKSTRSTTQHPAGCEYSIQHNELWLCRINSYCCSQFSVGEG